MIRVGLIRNVLEPHIREFHQLEYLEGMTLEDVGAPYWGDGPLAPYINGELQRDFDGAVADGDFVHLVGCPSGPVLGALWQIVKLIAAVLIMAAIIKELFPMADQSDTDTDPYLGFSNSYRPEGDAIPVIYGTIRAAHPCVNQSVLGGIFQLNNPLISHQETLNSLFAVSHGPIDGFGLKRQTITQRSDGGEHFFTGENALLEINGIDARHFVGEYEWRTGAGGQTPIIGNMGQIRYTDPGVTYTLNLQVPMGTESIPHAYSGEGGTPWANRIQEDDDTQYVHQFLSTRSDRAVVQFMFQKGLFHMNQDSGSFTEKSRIVQVQYWITDSSGAATPDTVTILEAMEITSNEPSMVSMDWPFELVNPTTIAGGGGRRGYAALDSYGGGVSGDVKRLMMDGTGTAGADLDLLHPGVLSDFRLEGSFTYTTTDPALKFSFAAWVRVPDWAHPITGDEPPVQWLCSWNREATQGAAWNLNSVPRASNLWAPDPLNSTTDSFGWAACIALDPDDIAGNGGVDASDPWVVMIIYTWDGMEGNDQAADMGAANGYMSRFISKKLGRASRFASDWVHVGFTWDQETWSADGSGADGGEATVKVYAEGRATEVFLDGVGANYPGIPSGGQGPGYLYGTAPTAGPYDGMKHVPLKFYADNKTTLRIGGWDNIGHTGSARFQRSAVEVGEYAFLATILPESWYQGQINSPDSFGNSPTASVSTLMANVDLEAFVRLASPMDNGDVVNTDFYKNYALPDATTQATGCLEIENTACVQLNDGPTYYAQVGTSEGAYYIMEVFADYPTEDTQNDQNTVTIESITTFLTDSYSYPGVAMLSTSIQGTDQISGTNPKLTTVVHGKQMNVWDGESVEWPTFRFEWSNNPAWIALDVLTNRAFGLGGIFSPEGTYEAMHLPAFFEWAAFCDEGVPDAYGTLPFFGMETGDPQYYSLKLFFGLTNFNGVSVQTIPNSWAVGKHMSITEIHAAEVGSEWVTKNDVVGGLNNASNLLEITDIQFKSSGSAPFHGWDSWFEVTVTRNRDAWLESLNETDSPYPYPGVFADQFGIAALGDASQYEYRARYNGALQKKNGNAWDELTGIFQNGRAIPMKIGRKVMPVWDRPREPVALVGQGNIKAGSFELSYSDPTVLPNSIEAEIMDADRNWQGQTVLVDFTGIQGTTEFQQLHKERISLPGCTSRSQATRDATYRLNRYALSRRVAKFEVGPDSIHLLPGDRIQVAHDVPEYGYSGRLPVAMQILNSWPTADSIFDSWTQQGGNCTLSDGHLLEEKAHALIAPPLVDYNNGVVLAYGVPTSNTSSEGQVLAGKGLDPGYERSPAWTGQFVSVGDGLYPTPDYDGSVPIGPLDRIDHLDKTVNFSVYIRQPADGEEGGFSTGASLVIYRICGETGYVKAMHGAIFEWDDALAQFASGGYIGDGPVGGSAPYGITAWNLDPSSPQLSNGWCRIAVTYENNANNGPGSAAVGDYIQARLFFNSGAYLYAPGGTSGGFTVARSFFPVSEGGNGNQFLYAGDPSNLDLEDNVGSRYWQGTYVNATAPVAGNKIVHEPGMAPLFYPQDMTTGTGTAGDRGYVILFDQDTGVTTTPFFMSQVVDVNFGALFPASSSALCTTRANVRMCFMGYFRPYFTMAEKFSCIINIRTSTAQTAEAYTGDGVTAGLTWDPSTGNFSVTSSAVDTISPGTITLAWAGQSQVKMRSKAAGGWDYDDEWCEFKVQFTSSVDYNSIGFQIGTNSSSGGGQRFYGWGFTLFAESVDGTPTATIPIYPHRGTYLWGPQYDPTYVDSGSAGEPPPFSSGAQLQLDRDVTVSYGTPAEIYLRSSFERDQNLNTDVTEVLKMAYNELPTVPGETRTLAARTWIPFSTPQKMFPRTGDIYSFGDSGSSTEDFVVVDIRTDPSSLSRKIECVEYNELIYDDTSFADIVDPNEEDPSGTGGGGVGDHGYGGNYDVTYDGPGFSSISITGRAAPYRASDGYLVPSWRLTWRDTAKVKRMPYKEVRLWAQAMPNGSYQYVATIPAGVKSYRYDDANSFDGTAYTFYIQPVGFTGTCLPVDRCPSVLIPGSVYAPLAEHPGVLVSTHGFNNVYNVTSGNSSRLDAIEGRIGGWIISTPAWIVDPNIGRFVSEALLPVPTDSAGFTQGIIYARGKTLGGDYGKLTTVTGTEEFVDVLSSRQLIAENDYATATDGSLDSNLYITSDVMHWNAASSSLGPVYYRCTELDATTARRTVVNAVIQGYQVRHETLNDLNFSLGSSTGRNWSLEGPMKDDGGNASVEIEWRWTSGASLSGVEWRTFEAGEVYARKVQFRLKWTRKNTGDEVKLERFTMICNDVPATTQVDGGTF